MFSRTFWWIVLVVSGFVALIVAVIVGPPPLAVATGLAAVGSWIAYGFSMAWYHGLRRHVARHLGPRWNLGEVLRHRIRTAERPNFQLALDWLQSQSNTVGPFGIRHLADMEEETPMAAGGFHGAELVALVEGNPEPVALVWEPMPTSIDETMHCASNALYLLRVNQEPVCVLIQGRSTTTSRRATLQLLARTQDAARESLAVLIRLANEQSVYRGQVISIVRPRGQTNDLSVQFHDLGRVSRDSIILPEEVLRMIERNILGFFRHAEALRLAGQGTRHGVLLHGPPGTGKTLVTRYLATHVGATVLLVTGRQYAQLRGTFQLARLLSPSLVILEDVDLIATDRRRNRHTALMHELLDEMDGLSGSSEIVFLLTTNRPEVLEPALAARPGRVDQAIYFPLPDLECRRRLFACFSTDVDLDEVEVDSLLERTEGASPAFLRELFRRAALMALERGVQGSPLRLQQDDFERALRELLHAGGNLTRSFLGFPSSLGLNR